MKIYCRILNILSFVFLITLTFMFGCNIKPSAEAIKNFKAMHPFLIRDSNIQGLYKYYDIDSVIFTYSTSAINEDQFWNELEGNLKNSRWKETSRTSNMREFERIFSKSEVSPDRTDMARFSSAEQIRIVFLKEQNIVIVGWVQADSLEDIPTLSGTGEFKWAKNYFWPRFNRIVRKYAPNYPLQQTRARGAGSGS